MINDFFFLLFPLKSSHREMEGGERESVCETRDPPYSCARTETEEEKERINEHD